MKEIKIVTKASVFGDTKKKFSIPDYDEINRWNNTSKRVDDLTQELVPLKGQITKISGIESSLSGLEQKFQKIGDKVIEQFNPVLTSCLKQITGLVENQSSINRYFCERCLALLKEKQQNHTATEADLEEITKIEQYLNLQQDK